METYAEFLKRRGRAEGLAKGLAKGRAEGHAEGLREATLVLLRKRFKRVPATVTRKLQRASASSLATWLSRAVDARSLAAVFEG